MRYVALLRGVNVGGKNQVAMPALVTLLEQFGCTSVRTYLQSGNVVFSLDSALAPDLPALLTSAIADRFGCHVPVVLRTAAEIHAVLAANPYLSKGSDALHVLFLRDRPTSDQVAQLDPERSAPDTFLVQGQEIYLHLPGGMGRTKLTNAYFDTKLQTVSTARNWRTVTKLGELLAT